MVHHQRTQHARRDTRTRHLEEQDAGDINGIMKQDMFGMLESANVGHPNDRMHDLGRVRVERERGGAESENMRDRAGKQFSRYSTMHSKPSVRSRGRTEQWGSR